MFVTGITNNFSIEEDPDKIRTVDNTFGAAKSSAFFMDRNPDRTQTPDFNRRLRESQMKLQEEKRKREDLKHSPDLKEVYEQMNRGFIGKIVDAYR